MNATPKHGDTETLRYSFGQTSLGTILVASANQGVAAILLGDNRQTLQQELKNIFTEAQTAEDPTALADTVATVARFIDAPHLGLDLPLDLRGSEQEIAIWTALRAIPPGETRSYGEIAKNLSVPATAQEVGAACAANRLAVAIPCHRVVKSDGSISGYRWGVHRKRRLINIEGVA
jgi:AraC family transcriptional regulator, regulatory protein of adaptative response / methylated-DNA-[protein]-cysteine methyltransferase